jgi:protein-S-isoprenylcysteine O-methyltransferase Ste14
MSPHDPGVIRALVLFLPMGVLWGLWLVRRPDRRTLTGAFLGFAWMLPAGFGLHLLAMREEFWHYAATGGLFDGLPVDIYLGWAILWGAVPILAFRRANLLLVVAAFLWADLILMPAAFPVVQLGRNWLAGEAIGLLIGLLPATLLARWTADDSHLWLRTLLQCATFTGIALGLIPAIILAKTHGSIGFFIHGPRWAVGLAVQLVLLIGVAGLSGVQEFVVRGGGTPLPWDPPRRLVATGPYAYLANPMQVSMTLLMGAVGVLIGSWWVAAAAGIAAAFGLGFAAWQEDGDLRHRFGDAWDRYRRSVNFWIPKWHPVVFENGATLYFASGCVECSSLARWLERRRPVGLRLEPAEGFPAPLRRLTYVGVDGHREQGVNALARALEHINLGLAFLGWTIRLPVVSLLVQLIADAAGAGPRDLHAASKAANSGGAS